MLLSSLILLTCQDVVYRSQAFAGQCCILVELHFMVWAPLDVLSDIPNDRAFGTWPVATMSAGEKKVVVEGPLCSASKVIGWFSRDFNDGTTRAATYNTETDLNPAGAAGTRLHTIDVSGFAFNSSILWDPERWGRPTSLPDTSQDSIKFVQEVVLEDRAKLKGIPSDCSQIMVWQYGAPSSQ